MKITGIETIPVSVPLRPELAIRGSRGLHSVSPFLIVKIHTDAGITGLGEVSCTPRWSGEDQVTAAHFISSLLAPEFIGEDPSGIDHLARRMDRALAGNAFTKAALEMALWDIAGRASGVPVTRLLGGSLRDSVATKWSVSGVDPARAAAIASAAVERGFRTLKVKVGIDREQDLARVRAVRAAVGPDVVLGVDANGAWTAADAVEIIRRLESCDIRFAEQPVAARDIAGMAEVKRKVAVPIIADESVYSPADARALAAAGAADVLSIYVGKSGGLGPAREIALIAQEAGLEAVIGSNLELGVGTAAMIHLAMSIPALSTRFPSDIIGPFYYERDIVADPLPLRAGEVRQLSGDGLGVILKPAQF